MAMREAMREWTGSVRAVVSMLGRAAIGLSWAAILGCAPGEKGGDSPLGQERDALVSLGSEPTSIAGLEWVSTTVGPWGGDASYDADEGSFTVTSGGNGAGMFVPGPPYDNDSVQFVYMPWTGDVEVVVRVVDAHAADGETPSLRDVQAGVMLRENDEVDAVMAAGWYANGESNCLHMSCACLDDATDGLISSFNYSSRAAFSNGNFTEPSIGPFDTDLKPPVWLRLQRVGKDFSFARRRDGGPWVAMGGGEFEPENALVGFYVGRQWYLGQGGLVASAKFESVYVGPPRVEYKTSWLEASSGAFSKGYLSNGMHAFYVAPNGTSFKYRAEADPAEHSVNRVASDGTIAKIPGRMGNAFLGFIRAASQATGRTSILRRRRA
jgi:hypothetical protein